MTVSAGLSADRGFSFHTWIALEIFPSTYEKPVAEQVSASIAHQEPPGRGFGLHIDPFGRWGLRVATERETIDVAVPATFPLCRWSHVAAVYDPQRGEAVFYLDGRRIAAAGKTRPSAFRPAATDPQIARSPQRAPLGVFNINGLNAAHDEVHLNDAILPERRSPQPWPRIPCRMPQRLCAFRRRASRAISSAGPITRCRRRTGSEWIVGT